MERIKLFSFTMAGDLEDAVNDWLKEHDGKIVILKIKYRLAFGGRMASGKWTEYNCFIHYRKVSE